MDDNTEVEANLGLKGNNEYGIVFEKVNLESSIQGINNTCFSPNEKDLHFSNISGEDKSSCSFSTQSPKSQFIEAASTVITSHFEVSKDISFFLEKSMYSMFVLSRKKIRGTSSTDSPIAVMLYTFSPCFGVFCPVIVVSSLVQGCGFGKSLLGYLQKLHFKRYKDNRIFVWISYCLGNDRKGSKGMELYRFYQKLGMHLTLQSELPIKSVMSSELFKNIMESQVYDANEHQNIEDKQNNFLLFTNSTLNVNTRRKAVMLQSMPMPKKKTDHILLKNEMKCDVCGFENKYNGLEQKETLAQTQKRKMIFVTCGYHIKNSSRLLVAPKSNKNDGKAITPICGSFMCYTCHNQFGFVGTKYCPIHLTTDDILRYNYDHNKELAKNVSNQMSNWICNSNEMQKRFFKPKYSYLNFNEKEDKDQKPMVCLHCHFQDHSSAIKLHTSYAQKDSRATSDHKSLDVANYEQMRLFPKQISCVVNKNRNHAPFFNSNSGDTWSMISNSVLGVKTVVGHGDCGYLCMKYAIESLPKKEYEKVTKRLFTYVCKQLEYYDKSFDQEYKNGIVKIKTMILKAYLPNGKRITKKMKDTPINTKYFESIPKHQQLNIKLLRLIIFLTQIDLDYIDTQYAKSDEPLVHFCTWMSALYEETDGNGDLPAKILSDESRESILMFQDKLVERFAPTITAKQKGSNSEYIMKNIIQENIWDWSEVYTRNSFQHYSCLQLEMQEVLSIPYVTKNEICILMTWSKSTETQDQSLYSNVYDCGYSDTFKKFILKECSNFILLRNLDGYHYDLVIDIYNGTAVHKIPNKNGNIKNQSPKYMAYNKVVSLLKPIDKDKYLGTKFSNTANEVDPFLMVIPEIYNYCLAHNEMPKLMESKKHIETWITKTSSKNLEDTPLYNEALHLIQWIEDASKFVSSKIALTDYTDTNVIKKVLLVEMNIGDYVPFIMDGFDSNNVTESFFGVGYLQKLNLNTNGSPKFFFKICDINKQSFRVKNKVFLTKFIKEIVKEKKIGNQKENDSYDISIIISLFNKEEKFSFVTKDTRHSMLVNVIHSVLCLKHGKYSPFHKKIFRDINVTPGPLGHNLEKNILQGLKKKCFECTENKHKELYYILYVAYLKKETWVHVHLMVYGTDYIFIISDYMRRKYAYIFQQSFILKTPASLKSGIIRFILSWWKNEKTRKVVMKKVAQSMFHKFFLPLTTFGDYIDLEQMNKYRKSLPIFSSNEDEVSSCFTYTDMTTDSHQSSIGNSVFDSVNARSSKHLGPKLPRKKLDSNSVWSDTTTENGDDESSVGDDNDSDVTNNIPTLHSTNWYKISLWCKNHDFNRIFEEKESSKENIGGQLDPIIIKEVSNVPIQIEHIVLICVFYKEIQADVLRYIEKYMKLFLKQNMSLKSIIWNEWKNAKMSIMDFIGQESGKLFRIELHDEDINKERLELNKEKANLVKTNDDRTQKSHPKSLNWKDFFNKNHNKIYMTTQENEVLKSTVTRMSQLLNQEYDDNQKNRTETEDDDVTNIVSQKINFENRPVSDDFQLDPLSTADTTIITIEDKNIRLRNILEALSDEGSFRSQEIDIAIRAFNAESCGKTNLFCLPISTYIGYYQKMVRKFTHGSFDNDLISNIINELGAFIPEGKTFYDIYDVLLMISPNLCSNAFHFNLMVFDLKNKIIQFFDPTTNDTMTPSMKQRNRIFFFNIFSIFLTFFHTWKDLADANLLSFLKAYKYPPAHGISSYLPYTTQKTSSVVLLMNVYAWISNKMALYEDTLFSTFNLLDIQNMKFFRNFVISLFLQYSGCRKISIVAETVKTWSAKGTAKEDTFHDQNLLLDNMFSELLKKNSLPNSIALNKSRKNEEKKTDEDDNKSSSSISAVTGTSKDGQFSFEDEYLKNFKSVKENVQKPNTQKKLRPKRSREDNLSSKEKKQYLPNCINKSVHTCDNVKEYKDLYYELTKDQKEAMVKLPRTKKDKANKDEYKYEQTNVHQQIQYIINKETCRFICYVSGEYYVTKTITPKISFAKKNSRNITSLVTSTRSIYPLEEDCISAILTPVTTKKAKKKLVTFQRFIRFVKSKKNWHEMPTEFFAEYKLVLKRKREAWAYHFMNFHAIQYSHQKNQLMGYCYHNKKVVYKEELRIEWIRNIEKLNRQYMVSVKCPGTLVSLNIGAGRDSKLKQDIMSTTTKHKYPKPETIAKTKNDELDSISDDSVGTLNDFQKADTSEGFQCISTITYTQGSKHTCYEYSIMSAIDNLIAYYKYRMKDSCETLVKSLKNLQHEIKVTIGENPMNTTKLLHTMKEIMDRHSWSTEILTSKNRNLLQNIQQFIEFCNNNEMSIVAIRIDDHTKSNNHWVSINNSYIFNTNWVEPVLLTIHNLQSCADNRNFKKLGQIYK